MTYYVQLLLSAWSLTGCCVQIRTFHCSNAQPICQTPQQVCDCRENVGSPYEQFNTIFG